MMTAQTKMIIITSDEDLIRQFTLNKAKNTHIIDLEDDQLDKSIDTNNKSLLNMALLAELSKLNSNDDQIYKRALDSPQQNSNKPSKISKKSMEMICSICGDRAIGFNYDVLSCASCKSFFRRNAHQDMKRIRCLTGRGQCPVGFATRRKCQKCRLERCFQVGMRKDFLQTDEEKQRRQQKLEENRSLTSQQISTTDSSILQFSSSNFDDIDRLLIDMNEDEKNDFNQISDQLFEILTVEEWINIENLRLTFLSHFTNDLNQQNDIDVSDRTSALISWSYLASQSAQHFIEFFRQINEFENLNNNDRFILIKYNIFPLYSILKCHYYNRINRCCSNGNYEEVEKHHQFYQLCFGTDGICDTFNNLVESLVELTEQDPAILSLLLTVLMFYEGLSLDENQPLSNDPLVIYRAQSYYTDLLWKYLISKWNEEETHKRFIRLIPIVFRIQLTSKCFQEYFRTQISTSDAVHKLAPLMQSFLHIS